MYNSIFNLLTQKSDIFYLDCFDWMLNSFFGLTKQTKKHENDPKTGFFRNQK